MRAGPTVAPDKKKTGSIGVSLRGYVIGNCRELNGFDKLKNEETVERKTEKSQVYGEETDLWSIF